MKYRIIFYVASIDGTEEIEEEMELDDMEDVTVTLEANGYTEYVKILGEYKIPGTGSFAKVEIEKSWHKVTEDLLKDL